MSLDEALHQALKDTQKHIAIARGFNDPIELGEDISPELKKLTKTIEAELELLNIKIDLYFNKQS